MTPFRPRPIRDLSSLQNLSGLANQFADLSMRNDLAEQKQQAEINRRANVSRLMQNMQSTVQAEPDWNKRNWIRTQTAVELENNGMKVDPRFLNFEGEPKTVTPDRKAFIDPTGKAGYYTEKEINNFGTGGRFPSTYNQEIRPEPLMPIETSVQDGDKVTTTTKLVGRNTGKEKKTINTGEKTVVTPEDKSAEAKKKVDEQRRQELVDEYKVLEEKVTPLEESLSNGEYVNSKGDVFDLNADKSTKQKIENDLYAHQKRIRDINTELNQLGGNTVSPSQSIQKKSAKPLDVRKDGKVKVKLSNGKVGYLDPKEFNSSTMEYIQ